MVGERSSELLDRDGRSLAMWRCVNCGAVVDRRIAAKRSNASGKKRLE
jgi:uncharacterized Zn finger protein